MNTGPRDQTENFLVAAPEGLAGSTGIAAMLNAFSDERFAVYGMIAEHELPMFLYEQRDYMLLSNLGLMKLTEQRGVGYLTGYVRGVRVENPQRFEQMVDVGKRLGPEQPEKSRPLEVPVSHDPMLTRPLELDAAELKKLTVQELQCRLRLRIGDMPGLYLDKSILVKMLLAVERTRDNMQKAICAADPNLPLRLL